MINDLPSLARVREREIRNMLLRAQHLPPGGGYRRWRAGWLRQAANRLGTGLIAVGRRLQIQSMEERPQHGS